MARLQMVRKIYAGRSFVLGKVRCPYTKECWILYKALIYKDHPEYLYEIGLDKEVCQLRIEIGVIE